MKKGFTRGKLGENSLIQKKRKNSFSVLKLFIIIVCVGAVLYVGGYFFKNGKDLLGFLGTNTIETFSQKFGQEMIKDGSGNVNVLLVGVGGEGHQGGYLSDTIIVGSRNQDLGAISMISIPRDLYINASGYQGRINSLFARGYGKQKSIISGVQNLLPKVQDILGLQIPYYAVVDFKGFKKVIDTVGGIELYVPNTIHDTTYPDEGIGYETFHISAGDQILDGETALKYARSRHTTSDFARSSRQQDIIKATVKKVLKKENIMDLSTVQQLYQTYTEMVTTNISLKEMIGAVQYVDNMGAFDKIYTFGLNTRCGYSSYKTTDAGCFLYNGDRDSFGGMAVLIPNGASASNVSFYDYIKNFSSLVMHNQGYLVESPRITVINAIEKGYAAKLGKSHIGWANKVAVKLKKFGFNLVGAENADPIDQTTVIVYGKDYENTVNTLKNFLPFDIIQTGQILSGQELDYDIQLFIGNDFIDHIKQVPFSYEK